MNPKVYFKITDGILVPIKGQSAILDAFFKSTMTKKKNALNYNEYTKTFIQGKTGSYNIYKSDNYSWDPELHTFNFSVLEEISDDEYIDASTYVTSMDPNKKYDIVDIEKIKSIDVTDNTFELPTNTSFVDFLKTKYPKPTINKCGMHIENEVWNYLVRNILKKRNTILVGPTGTGKTEVVMMIAKMLNIPCHVYDMGSMQDPLTDLLGSHRLENGSSVFDYAKFTEHVQEPCIIVLDELSRAPLMANNILFPCLDSRRELPVEIAGSKDLRNIKIHPDCVFIATANIGIEYSGTNDIDAALMNRFLPLQLDYIQAKHEIEVLTNRTDVNKEQATKIVNFANRIRQDYKEEKISKSCSTRECIAMAELVADGFSYTEAFKYVILYKYSNPEDEEVAHINRILISL